MSYLKELLLQMKLDANYEMRILAEETIVNMFDDLRAENERLKQQVAVYEKALNKYIDESKHWPMPEKMYDEGKRYSDIAIEALEKARGEK